MEETPRKNTFTILIKTINSNNEHLGKGYNKK